MWNHTQGGWHIPGGRHGSGRRLPLAFPFMEQPWDKPAAADTPWQESQRGKRPIDDSIRSWCHLGVPLQEADSRHPCPLLSVVLLKDNEMQTATSVLNRNATLHLPVAEAFQKQQRKPSAHTFPPLTSPSAPGSRGCILVAVAAGTRASGLAVLASPLPGVCTELSGPQGLPAAGPLERSPVE